MKLELIPEGSRDKNGTWVPKARVLVTAYRDDKIVERLNVNPNRAEVRDKFVKLGVDSGAFLQALLEAQASGEKRELTFVEPAATHPDERVPFSAIVRRVESTSGRTIRGIVDTLGAIQTTPVTELICWTEPELGCLDIDYHDTVPPPKHHLEAWVESRISPTPHVWHFSRSGGLHLFYTQVGNITGKELAACAALHYKTLDPSAGVELKRQIRGAGDEKVRVCSQQHIPESLASWGGSLGAEGLAESAEWLEARGLQMNQRYPHTACPIDPSDTATGDPVEIGEFGVYCHRCAGKGIKCGGRKPGFASWATLTGDTKATELSLLVSNLVHWGHAKWVLVHKYGLVESLARDAYSAALKLSHPDDPRVAMAFNRDLDDLARTNDSWSNIRSSYVYPGNSVGPLIRCLPAACVINEDGEVKAKESTTAYLSQGHDLAERGYSNIQVIQGYRLAERYLPTPPNTIVAVPAQGIPAPRYRKGDVKAAERVIEKLFPGLDWNCVRTLICAAGCAQETQLGLHPLLFLSGASASGKTTTPRAAMGILGSRVFDVVYKVDEEKQKQHIKEGGAQAAIVLANEFIKDSTRALRRFDPRAAMESLLNLTPNVSCWKLYSGPQKMGRLPAFVMTEPQCPYLIRNYTQLARRIRYMRLAGGKQIWKDTLADAGLGGDSTHLFRRVSRELNEAADVILGDIVDTCFDSGYTWDALADRFGAKTILEHEAFDNPDPAARRLFALVCKAPGITDKRLKRHYDSTYRQIHRTNQPTELDRDLFDAYTHFADADWVNSQLLGERNWSQLLGVPDEEVEMDLKTDGNASVFIRFRVGPQSRPVKVNGDIIDLSRELDDES